MSESVDIVWLRDDFRLDDQPPFTPRQIVRRSSSTSMTNRGGARPLGGAAKWRLAESLTALERELSTCGGRLDILIGDAEETILALAAAANAGRILWTHRYEGGAKKLDARVEQRLKSVASRC